MRRIATLALTGATLALAAAGCGGDDAEGGPAVEPVLEGHGLNAPSALAARPGRDELWVTNRGDDSITIVTAPGSERPRGVTRRDAYAEHFVARPAGIAFDETGRMFAVANDSNNEVRDMVFVKQPERNRFFKGSNFMGPALFYSATYAHAGQSKAYLEDWPQPGFGHDPPDDIPRDDCPPEYWSVEAEACQWPREGSHVDMLHGSPLSVGIVHDRANAYYLLDGCGSRTADNACEGDGHVVMVDFNRDHQEGNGFHGDGVIRRFPQAPFTRVDGVSAGMAWHDGVLYYADTGGGAVRRLDPAGGEIEVLVDAWHGGPASHHRHGNGIESWSDTAHGPPDGDEPATVAAWIEEQGDAELIAAWGDDWIRPMESLGEYSYVRGAIGEPVAEIGEPAGLAATDQCLFVADHATGVIHELAWDGLTERRTIDTGLDGLDGLVVAGDWLYLTDAATSSVHRVAL